jgi:acyl-CoA synthetase (AMP-forming)/AMP-acid ligase II
MNIGSLFSRHARYYPEKTAFVFQNGRYTWRQWNASINRTAQMFQELGIGKGDKVATVLSNRPELLETYWAAAKIGAIVVPLSTLLLPEALKSLLNDSDASTVITEASFEKVFNGIKRELIHIHPNGFLLVDEPAGDLFNSYHSLRTHCRKTEPQASSVLPSDPFNIMYSSGTTGMPKGIVHSHYIRAMYGACFAASFRIMPESVVLHSGAVVFNGAFVDMMPAMFVGACYVLMDRFNPEELIDTVYRENVTHTMMVPSQIVAVLGSPDFSSEKLSSLEMVLSLGAPLHKEHKEALNRLLPGRFYELYGLTEGFITILDKKDYFRKPDSVGVPPPFFDMRIVDSEDRELPAGEVGEICGRGPILMTGYYKRDDLTREAIVDGWLHSGDLGYVDEDGFLYLVDRIKDMIVTGGVNVYPRDIEEVIVGHPDVCEAAVFGMPDDKWGETPVAAVTVTRAASLQPEALRTWINERVAAKFQRVSRVTILEEFPRNAAGKILKRTLRDRLTADSL